MAALHEALQCLQPTSWEEIPKEHDKLRGMLRELFGQARVIVDSVPEEPEKKTSNTKTNTNTDLQKEWGKPLKVNSKENPLGIPLYKLTGADGKGTWFARRSVHEGLPFSVWKSKIASEIAETLRGNTARKEQGLPPDYAVRGIGAERKLEDIEVMDDENRDGNGDGDGGNEGATLARLELYHVSVQFPRPTTSRDFVPLVISSEIGLNGSDVTAGKGRSLIILSKPCRHGDVPPDERYIRGQYESVEIIREIPRSSAAKTEPMNPVEWIMVTRSDPGGNIPRWMVEKGTPRSILTDAAKFVQWASQDDKASRDDKSDDHSTGDIEPNLREEIEKGNGVQARDEVKEEEEEDGDENPPAHTGLIASVAHLLNMGVDKYAPQAVRDYIPHFTYDSFESESDDNSTSEPISDNDFAEKAPSSQIKVEEKCADEETDSHTSVSLASDIHEEHISPLDLIQQNKNGGKLSSREKELAKLALRKREVESRLDSLRSEIEALHIRPTSDTDLKTDKPFTESDHPSTVSSSNGQSSSSTATAEQRTAPQDAMQLHKAASSMLREESKLFKQLRKIEASQLRVAAKIEARQRKRTARDDKHRSRSEVDALRQEVHGLKREVEKLRAERRHWLDLVASLQAENSRLVSVAQ
ncbi:hypothetical protein ASPZODRAFT_64427 [Penicilliopsis zonata CBS 506.65]|uniref:DUF3074 domain-containing protein n=1 Tax=Penicilliopsis zonata CBS 506.65 TaxID=1073090 RepID=A0A1L9SKE8_9EURO|nr:hypothetical protein ASPZODRAFT_64427 [Penicilliopsis zonata CBS 506.65]OJJ47637.1 hypothetical protein ASPZODRAFT_64427 [Penicilliopsis zonata CBS 506.65]